MSEQTRHSEDMTGRSRLARNLVFAWGGYLANVLVGFVMPRLISDRLGQTTLGLWDFVWSIISYFGLIQMGIAGSVQRYVAKYRAVNDRTSLCRSVSTVAFSLFLAGLLCLIVVGVTATWVLPLFHHKIGDALSAVRLAVIFLGLEIAFGIMLMPYGGVVVGCHRWDIHNTISAIAYSSSGVGMFIAIHAGGGLPALALIHAAAFTLGDLARWRASHKVCPELKVDYGLASRQVFFEQFRFSSKELIPQIGNLVSNQTLSVLVTLYLSPASLALFARPRALVLTLGTLTAKAGSVLIPTVSSLQAQSDHKALERTFGKTISASSFLVFPPIIVLTLLGDYVLRLWMGPNYAHWSLIAIVALGNVALVANEPVWCILVGLNKHGRLALARLGAAVCSMIICAIGLVLFKWGLIEAAVCWSLPRVFVDLFLTPAFASRAFGLPLKDYYQMAYFRPFLWLLPFTVCVAVARVFMESKPYVALALMLAAVIVLGIVFYIAALPASLKLKIKSTVAALPVSRALLGVRSA